MHIQNAAFGRFPVDALVGDGLAVGEFFDGAGKALVSCHEVALEHGAENAGRLALVG